MHYVRKLKAPCNDNGQGINVKELEFLSIGLAHSVLLSQPKQALTALPLLFHTFQPPRGFFCHVWSHTHRLCQNQNFQIITKLWGEPKAAFQCLEESWTGSDKGMA